MDRNVAKLTNVESRRLAGTGPERAEPEGTEPEGTEPEGTEPEGTEPEAEGPTGEDRPNDVGGVPPPADRGPTRRAPNGTLALDRAAIADDAVGDDTIREGRSGGIQGPHHASRGQGQGG
jgi:hypothetical protein